MAAVDHTAIRYTFRKRMEDTVADFATLVSESKVDFENMSLDPDIAWPIWAKETLLPGQERQVSSGIVEDSGLYELDILFPVGRAMEDADALAKSIVSTFKPGLGLAIVGVADRYLSIDRSQRKAAFKWSDVWSALPVLVTWRAYELISSYT